MSLRRLLIFTLVLLPSEILAGPPFITNDPYPTDYKNWEIYFFGAFDKTIDELEAAVPGLELNYGLLHNLQSTISFPVIYSRPDEDGERKAYSLSDIQLEAKYAFVKETKTMPEIAFDPTIFIPTGDSKRGLGNGRVWSLIPIWIGKKFKSFEVYGGGGYAINSAPDARNFFYGGTVIEYDVTKKLMLGVEFYIQGPDSRDSRSFATLGLGGSYDFKKHMGLLFMLNHNIWGEQHTIGYFGIAYTT